MKGGLMSDALAGDVRPSQIIWSYGPGATLDLPELSAVVMGLDYWKKSNWEKERCPGLSGLDFGCCASGF